MNACSFTIHLKKISECPKVFVECLICFGELEEASSSSFQSTPLVHETSPNTKTLKRACIESLRHFDASGSQNPRSYGGTNFIVYRNLVSPSLTSHTQLLARPPSLNRIINVVSFKPQCIYRGQIAISVTTRNSPTNQCIQTLVYFHKTCHIPKCQRSQKVDVSIFQTYFFISIITILVPLFDPFFPLFSSFSVHLSLIKASHVPTLDHWSQGSNCLTMEHTRWLWDSDVMLLQFFHRFFSSQ